MRNNIGLQDTCHNRYENHCALTLDALCSETLLVLYECETEAEGI